MNYEERRVKFLVSSKHSTTDALIQSKAATIVSQGSVASSKLDTIKSYTDQVEEQISTVRTVVVDNNSMLETIKAQTGGSGGSVSKIETAISKIETVKSYTDTVESGIQTVKTDVNSTLSKATTAASFSVSSDSKASTIKAQNNITQSKIETVKSFTGDLESMTLTVQTGLQLSNSRILTVKGLVETGNSKIGTVSTVVNNINSKVDTDIGIDTQNSSKLNTIINAVATIQNNISTKVVVAPTIERPDSGSSNVRINVYNYNSAGNMEDPDSNEVYLKIVDSGGNVVVSRTAITREGVGRYYYNWSISSSTNLDHYWIEVDLTENGNVRYNGAAVEIVEITGISGEIASKHSTTNALVSSKAGTILTSTNLANSRLITVKAYTQNNDSKLETIKFYTSDLDSMLTTTHTDNLTTHSMVSTVKEYVDSVESVLNTVYLSVDGVEGTLSSIQDTQTNHSSKLDTIINTSTNEASKVDTVHEIINNLLAGGAVFEFTQPIFDNVNPVSSDGNDEVEINTTNATTTSYTKMHTKEIGKFRRISARMISMVIDLGWNGEVSGSGSKTGKSRFFINNTDQLSGAIPLTDEVSEGATKTSRWRQGQITVPDLEMPSYIMLAGKVTSDGDTLVCKGFAGSSVTVVYHLGAYT